MVVMYKYKGEIFEDIRDIFLNNKLKPDFDFIYEEYIPYQISLSGRTFFEGVILFPTSEYEPTIGSDAGFNRHEEIVKAGIQNTMKTVEGPYAITLSGGLDSGILALETSPSKTYSIDMGHKNEWEAAQLQQIIDKKNLKHTKYTITEEDCITAIDDIFSACGFHLGGFGGMPDFACMKKFTEENPEIRSIVLGYGGDEIFLGYLWNFLCLKLPYNSTILDLFNNEFSGFSESYNSIIGSIVDNIIITSLTRGNKDDCFDNWTIRNLLRKTLVPIKDILSKVLYVNINIMEPSFLHVIQQQCKFYGVAAVNPLVDDILIKNAYELNIPIPQSPKEVLRKMYPEYKTYRKTGNPLPLDKWSEMNKSFRELWYSLNNREIFGNFGEYPGLNRYSWGIGMTELWLRRFYDHS